MSVTTELNRIINARETIKNKAIDLNIISDANAKIDECAAAINNITNLGAINYTFDSEIATSQTIPAGYTSGGNIIITQITHCYYDGLRLPKPPADSIAAYPYCWIRDNDSTGNYDLIMGTTRFYYDASNTRLKHVGSDTDLWYRIPKSTAESANSWGSPVGHSYVGWGLGSDRTAFWANHDVTNGESSSSIYLYGSDPVPEISGQEFLNMVEEVL